MPKEKTNEDSFSVDDSLSSRYSGDNNMNASDIFGEIMLDEDKKKEIPQLMIHPNSPFKSTWNIVILLLVIFQSVVIPVRIAFEKDVS